MKKAKKQYVIPVFIPHLGCPNDCSFCNQKSISGKTKMPTKEEVIGLKKFNQKEDNSTDTVFYEFNKFVKLATEMNPNIIEMLGCKDYLVFNEVGEALLNNVNLFLSKKCIYTFSGYAKDQLRRIENALTRDTYTQEETNKHIKNTMDVAICKLSEERSLFKLFSFI